MKEKNELLIRCSDRCSIVSFDRDEESTEISLTVYKSYAGHSFYERLTKAWAILTGGSYCSGELFIEEKDLKKIKKF